MVIAVIYLTIANMEAMVTCLPVIASAVGGFQELVQHEVNGLLAPPGDAEALAHAVGQLLDVPARVASMAQAARRTVEEGFTWRHHAEKLLRVYMKVMDRKDRDGKCQCLIS